jgi:uncharacterized membrane protein required for colicin V production
MAISWLDTLLIVFFAFQLILGFQQGLVLGLLSLVGYGLALVAILIGAPWLAAYLNQWLNWPTTAVVVSTAVILLVLIRLATGWVTSRLHLHMAERPHLTRVNRWLGLLPGATWGVLSTLLIAWLYSAFMGQLPPNSPIASRLLATGEKPMNQLVDRLPGGLPNIVLMPSGWEVIAGDAPASNVPPTQLEQQMLTLVNQERKKQGLKPLVWDGRLAEVGRRHSKDMIAKDYFAHEDPKGQSVADRAREARVGYFLIGENLAFAPNLAIAHRGLMESPGHRENILRPGFERLGIGIVRVGPKDDYVPIHKGKAPPKQLRGYKGYLVVTQVFKR